MSQRLSHTVTLIRPHLPWVLASVLGGALSITLFIVVGALEKTRLRSSFDQLARGRATAIQQSVNNSLEALQALSGLFAASERVNRNEFHAFCETVLPRHPEIQSLEWIPRIPLAERAAFEEGRHQGSYGAAIFEINDKNQRLKVARRPEYFPVSYTEPLPGNEGTIGFDVASEAARKQAMEKARDTGQHVATSRVHLVQKPDDRFGIIMFMPVYRNGQPHETVEERRRSLQGYVLAVFDIQRMVDVSLLGMKPSGADIWLFDESASKEERFLYRAQPSVSKKERATTAFEWTTVFDVGGRTWSIYAYPTTAFFFMYQSWLPWVTLAVGVLLTLLLANVLFNGLRRSIQVERLVTVRTAELTRAVAQRTLAEQALRKAHSELEVKVQERTRELSAANERLKAYYEQVRAMAARLQSVREDERTGIARELHDELGQLLTSLKMDLVWVGSKLLPEQVQEREQLLVMTRLVDQMVETVQRISSSLRPRLLDDFGLLEAIQWQGQEFARRSGIRCTMKIETDHLALDPACSISLFRILQEALTNVARHAKATEVTVRLFEESGAVNLVIADNGQGITPEQLENKGSLGLLGMQERSLLIQGEFTITPGPGGCGTALTVRVPTAAQSIPERAV